MTAPGERFVLVTVRIATEGRCCASYQRDERCRFLRFEWSDCVLFHSDRGPMDLVRIERDESIGTEYLRAPQCLALDELNAPGAAERERTPEEAQMHGLGEQNG